MIHGNPKKRRLGTFLSKKKRFSGSCHEGCSIESCWAPMNLRHFLYPLRWRGAPCRFWYSFKDWLWLTLQLTLHILKSQSPWFLTYHEDAWGLCWFVAISWPMFDMIDLKENSIPKPLMFVGFQIDIGGIGCCRYKWQKMMSSKWRWKHLRPWA